MGPTMNHDTRYLQSIRGDELSRYIDSCMTAAYAEARNSYRMELQEGLEAQARDLDRQHIIMRVPLPLNIEVGIGETPCCSIAERVKWVEFTPDQIRAFSQFLTGVRP